MSVKKTGSGGASGSGVSGRVALWNGANSLTSDSGITWSAGGLQTTDVIVSGTYFNSASSYPSGTAFYTNNGGAFQTGSATWHGLSGVPDSGSAIAFQLNSVGTLSTAGALLLSLENNSVQKLAVSKDGDLTIQGSLSGPASVSGAVPLPSGANINQGKALYLNGASQTVGLFEAAGGHVQFFGAVDYTFDNSLKAAIVLPTNAGLQCGLNSPIDLASEGTFNVAASTMAIDSRFSPAISSGFGSSPSVPHANGTFAFTLNVGTGGTANSGVINMGATAAHGWALTINNLSTNSSTVFITKQTATSTTTATIGNYNTSGAAAAWASGDILSIVAVAY